MSLWITCPLDIKEKIQQFLKFNLIKEFKEKMYKLNNKKYGYGNCPVCCIKYNRFQPEELTFYKQRKVSPNDMFPKFKTSVGYLCRECKSKEPLNFMIECNYEGILTENLYKFNNFRLNNDNNNEIATFGKVYKTYPNQDDTTFTYYGNVIDYKDINVWEMEYNYDGSTFYRYSHDFLDNLHRQKQNPKKYL